MKPMLPILLIGLVVGLLIPLPFPRETPAKATPRATKSESRPATPATPGSNSLSLAESAATLTRAQWPSFFESHLASANDARLLARLWAEADPAGFWQWLRERKDRLMLESFGPDLLALWSTADPDAAMEAVMAITDKDFADSLRRKVIDTVLESDLEKGIAFARMAGDFNRFSWGGRSWISEDPKAAVRALETLPPVSDYRDFLKIALPEWAKKSPLACLNWMRDHPPLSNEQWGRDYYTEGFKAAAIADKEKALAIALSLVDPLDRENALKGVLASGTLDGTELSHTLPQLSPQSSTRLAAELIRNRPSETLEDLRTSDSLLRLLPMSRHGLSSVGALATSWADTSPETALDWAASLPDAAMRRVAYQSLLRNETTRENADLAALPFFDLSNDLFQAWLNHLPADSIDQQINNLPADRGEWARRIAEER